MRADVCQRYQCMVPRFLGGGEIVGSGAMCVVVGISSSKPRCAAAPATAGNTSATRTPTRAGMPRLTGRSVTRQEPSDKKVLRRARLRRVPVGERERLVDDRETLVEL